MYVLTNKPRKSPLDVTMYYLSIIDNLNSANNKGTPVFITDNPDLLDNPEYFLNTTNLSAFANNFNQLFASIGETRVVAETYYENNTGLAAGFSFVCQDNIYAQWSIVTNWATFLTNFDLISEKSEFDPLTCVAKAAPSNQLNQIAFDNINFDKHLQPLMYFWGYFAKSLPDDSVYPAAIMTISDMLAVYPEDVFYGDGNSAANVNYLTKIGAVDRHYAGRYILLYSRSSVDAKNIYGYSITQLPTVQKWDGTITTSNDGKSASFTPTIIPMPQGGVADINVSLSWSISGTVYQPASTPLTGLQPNATYTAYVKDQFNGVRTYSFVTTPAVEPELIRGVDPFFKIENCNSLKYYEVNAKSPFFDNAKMVDQLYYNIEMQCRKQPVLTTDIITTQIKSTYRDITVSIVDVDGVEEQAPVVELKIQNTEKKDKRDAVMVRSIDGLNTYIYFGGGSLYTPDTTTVIGTYTGISTLPSWCQIGMYVLITGGGEGLHQVTDIIYDEALQKWMLVINYGLGEASIVGTCQSLYNAENYNIYEFDSTFGALPVGDYEIIVNATDEDPTFPPVQWRSEWLKLRATHKKHLTVTYSHDEPINQIDYSTGIEHILHVPARFITYSPKNDSERFDSDDGRVVPLKSINTRVITFETALIPQWLVEKLVYSSGHKNLAINGYSCTLVEQPEITPKHEGNNPFYLFKMDLQLDESIIITDSTGIVSESANVLGSTTDTVLGI